MKRNNHKIISKYHFKQKHNHQAQFLLYHQQKKSQNKSHSKEYTKKGKGNYKEAVEVSKYEIKPNYQIIRKQSSFSSLIITHDFIVKVFNPQNIGFLVDTFFKYPSVTLKQFQWKPLQEIDSEQAAIKAGYEEGEDLCDQIGLALSQTIDIQQLNEDQPAEEQGQDQQQEPAPDVIVYRFVKKLLKNDFLDIFQTTNSCQTLYFIQY